MCALVLSASAAVPPTVTSITPDSARSGHASVFIRNLAGTGFAKGATVKLTKSGQADIVATRVVVASSRRITCVLDLSTAAPGAWDVVVTNQDGGSGRLTGGFTVLPPYPRITSITPDNAGSGNPSVSATVSGARFLPGVQVRLARTPNDYITASVVSVTPTSIECTFDLTGAQAGIRDVVVRNADGGSDTLENGFRVNPAPVVRSIIPNQGGTGNPSLLIIHLGGSRFEEGAQVFLARTGYAPIQASGVTVVSRASITCTLDLTGAALGAWDVTVINPDGGRGVLGNGFRVTSEPTVLSVTPDNAGSGNENASARITGAGFSPGATVKLVRYNETIQASRIDELTPTSISCTFDLRGARQGYWDVVVTNPDGGFGTLADGFRITRAPRVNLVLPNSAPSGKAGLGVTVYGLYFAPGASVALSRPQEGDIQAAEVTFVSSSRLTCVLDLTNALPGTWDVHVTNPDGGRGVRLGGFTMTEGPTVTSITPSSAQTGETVQVTDLSGDLFQAGATVRLTREGQPEIAATEVVVVSPQKITCTLNLTGASPGAWNVVVTNPDGGSGSLGGGFTVDMLPPPTVTSILPDWANSEDGVVPVTVTGTEFSSGAQFKLSRTGHDDIDAQDETVVSSTELSGTLNINQAASGSWDVVVTNPDYQSGTLPNGFTVNPPPSPTSITPESAGSGATEVRVTITGTHLDHTGSVILEKGELRITASNLSITSPTQITCLLDLTDAEPGAWDLVVTDIYSGEGRLPEAFTVNPAPAVYGIDPDEARTGDVIGAEVTGSGFVRDATVKLVRGSFEITSATDFNSEESLTCTLDLTGAEVGAWSVEVINQDGGTGTWSGEFTVTAAQTLISIEVTPSEVTLENNSQQQFEAIGRDQDGAEIPITPDWSCDTEAGEIDPAGLFTALGWGTVEVTASVGDLTGKATVHIPSYIGGTYQDLTLEKRLNPWILTHDLTVNGTLYIEPGVVVKAVPSARPTIWVNGRMDAPGTQEDPIRMTSYADDSIYGDTNRDGSSEGRSDDWGGITFQNNLQASSLSHVYSRYARIAYNNYSASSPILSQCRADDTAWYGFLTYGGTPELSQCEFTDGLHGVYVCNAGSIQMTGCTVTDMTEEGFFTDTTVTFTVDANTFERCKTGIIIADVVLNSTVTNNEVNNSTEVAINLGASAPENVRYNHGQGNAVNGIRVAGVYGRDTSWNATNRNPEGGGQLPWTLDRYGWYHPTYGGSCLVVAENQTLTIQAGAVAKTKTDEGGPYIGWAIVGRVVTRGTSENPVVITSIKDDTVWGDTDNNGPYPGDLRNDGTGLSLGWWAGASSQGIDLEHTTFRCLATAIYGGTPAGYQNTVRNCRFEKCYGAFNIQGGDFLIGDPLAPNHDSVVVDDCVYGGYLAGSGPVRITHSTFRNMSDYGLTVDGDGTFTLDENTIQDCANNGIEIASCAGGSAVSSNLIERCGCGVNVDGCGETTTIASNEINECTEFLGMVTNSEAFINAEIYGNSGSGSGRNSFEIGGITLHTGQSKILGGNPVPYSVTRGPLTVESGGALLFNAFYGWPVGVKCSDYQITIQSGGLFNCNSALITSMWDRDGGRTLNTAEGDRDPESSDWLGINVESGSLVSITNSSLRYGGGDSFALIRVAIGASPELHDLNFRNAFTPEDPNDASTGVYFAGPSSTSLTGCLIEHCQKGVSYAQGNTEPSAVVNDCKLWNCGYGVYAHSLIDDNLPINAQDNDWNDDQQCPEDDGRKVKNGPGPAGDGSRVNNVEAIDILPWTGLQQDLKLDDDDVNRPEIDLHYTAGQDLDSSLAALELIEGICQAPGVNVEVRQFKSRTDKPDMLSATERDGRDLFNGWGHEFPQFKGQDPFAYDNADLTYIDGHAAITPRSYAGSERLTPIYSNVSYDLPDVFYSQPESGRKDLLSSDIAWGDQDLEWVVVDGCRFFAKDTQVDTRCGGNDGHHGIEGLDNSYDNHEAYFNLDDIDNRLRPVTIDKGLHLVMGHATVSRAGSAHAKPFTERILEGDVISDAYTEENRVAQQYDDRSNDSIQWDTSTVRRAGGLTIVYGATSCLNDHFWGRGTVSQDPVPGAETDYDWSSSDQYMTGSPPGEAGSPHDPLHPDPDHPSVRDDEMWQDIASELSISDSDPNEDEYRVEPGNTITIHAESCEWQDGGVFPMPFDDRLFGGNRGVSVYFHKADSEESEFIGPKPAHVSNDTEIAVKLPSEAEGFTREDTFQVFICNKRTFYWGYLDKTIFVKLEQPNP
ncbi:MAG: right-handed parallel beta-helix repeat-containing protein [Actinobacteria bacterium]|nr:right-handed parallel beta-helix repeat-containing protein [Actinomycetota bacterium]MBU1943859.1 right-handed parallel beta-helix repeat-containing protein [Actinomycetota bacterium]MBU2687680.1 right-handed parallel beta-helix repeat-containing protein [Actinomycetota bacterium]